MTPINKLLGTKMFPIRTLQIYKDNKDIKNLKREEKDFLTKVYYNSTEIITKNKLITKEGKYKWKFLIKKIF